MCRQKTDTDRPYYVVVAVLLIVVGPVGPTTTNSKRSNGKPEAATAVDKLLMMGMRMPETC